MSEAARSPGPRPQLPATHAYGKGFWVLAVVGWGVIAFGALTLVQHSGSTKPVNFSIFFLGLAMVHDFLLAPLVLGISVLIVRRVPAPLRPGVEAGALISGVLVLFSLPMVLGLGGLPDNPTLLPNNYAAGLGACLLVVWIVSSVVMLRAWKRRSARAPEAPK